MIAALIVVGYVMLGIGTARYVAGAMRTYMGNRRHGPGYWDFTEPEMVFSTVLGGVFWPFAWVWLLIVRPTVKVVGPAIANWFLAPYHKAAQR